MFEIIDKAQTAYITCLLKKKSSIFITRMALQIVSLQRYEYFIHELLQRPVTKVKRVEVTLIVKQRFLTALVLFCNDDTILELII